MTVHSIADAADIDVHRTEANASAAPHTLNADAILIHIIFQFVHKSLAHSMQFGVSGIVPGTMQCKQRIHAAVPIAHADTAIAAAFVLDVETPAGGAHIGTGAAIDARKRNIFPKRCIVKFGGIDVL
jgi:hypothetical protein